jgi:hypothetical protein
MWIVEPLVVSIGECGELERRVRAQTTSHQDRQRAEVILLAAEGVRVAGSRLRWGCPNKQFASGDDAFSMMASLDSMTHLARDARSSMARRNAWCSWPR